MLYRRSIHSAGLNALCGPTVTMLECDECWRQTIIFVMTNKPGC